MIHVFSSLWKPHFRRASSSAHISFCILVLVRIWFRLHGFTSKSHDNSLDEALGGLSKQQSTVFKLLEVYMQAHCSHRHTQETPVRHLVVGSVYVRGRLSIKKRFARALDAVRGAFSCFKSCCLPPCFTQVGTIGCATPSLPHLCGAPSVPC